MPKKKVKQPKPIEIVLVEHMGENGDWEWYNVARDTTPKKAIRNYLKDMNLNHKQKISPTNYYDTFQGYVAEEDDVRALTLEI